MADQSSPAIRTGDIQKAEFTVNRFTVEGGEVTEEERSVEMEASDLAGLEAEIESAMDDRLADLTGEAGSVTPPTGSADEEPAPDDESGEEALDRIAQMAGTTTEEQEEEPQREATAEDLDDPMDVGRAVVQEHDIEHTDFVVFAKHMREAGVDDQDTISEVWGALRDDGVIPESGGDNGGSDGGQGGDEEAEEEGMEPSGRGEDDGEESEPDADIPPAPDNLYLLTTTGCPGCAQAKEFLSDHIEAGLVEPINIQESDLAADIVIDTGIGEAPALVEERDGEYQRVQPP